MKKHAIQRLSLAIAIIVILIIPFNIIRNRIEEAKALDPKNATEPIMLSEEEMQLVSVKAGEQLSDIDFTLTNDNGDEVRFSDYLGKPLAIFYFRTGCSTCASQLKMLNDVYDEMHEELNFLIVEHTDNAAEPNTDDVKAYMSQNNLTFPYYYDTNHSFTDQITVKTSPAGILVNSDGTVAATLTSGEAKEQIKAALTQLT